MITGPNNHPRHAEEGEAPGYYVGRIMLIFRVHSSELDAHKDAKGNDVFWRDFCLVRRLMPANRRTDGPFPYEKCEVRDADADPNMPWLPVRDRLGMLWVWAKDVNDGPIYEVLTAQEVVETYPIMPRWVGETKKWSIETGVFNNRFIGDTRRRPPFENCDCAGARPPRRQL